MAKEVNLSVDDLLALWGKLSPIAKMLLLRLIDVLIPDKVQVFGVRKDDCCEDDVKALKELHKVLHEAAESNCKALCKVHCLAECWGVDLTEDCDPK